MNKKGKLVFSRIVNIILILVFVIIISFFLFKSYLPAAEEFVGKGTCQTRISMIMGFNRDIGVGTLPVFLRLKGSCEEQKITIESVNEDGLFKKLAELSYNCWERYGFGEKDFVTRIKNEEASFGWLGCYEVSFAKLNIPEKRLKKDNYGYYIDNFKKDFESKLIEYFKSKKKNVPEYYIHGDKDFKKIGLGDRLYLNEKYKIYQYAFKYPELGGLLNPPEGAFDGASSYPEEIEEFLLVNPYLGEKCFYVSKDGRFYRQEPDCYKKAGTREFFLIFSNKIYLDDVVRLKMGRQVEPIHETEAK